ncbi:ubiquitin-related domain-containing protein [Coniochaeta sp. 2T2.1]|nr:ubiquitin-related domain-containing protein [Coniochaeta sp. 2T2.1]
MADKEPQAAAPALAGDAAEQRDINTVQPTSTEIPSDAQPSSDPIPPQAATSSSEKPASSSTDPTTSQQSSSSPVAAAAVDSDEKGKQPAATTPPAPPTKEQLDGGDGDSLSIEPSQPITPSDNPVCNITLLLPTGARHPYKIDERYLTKRSVDVPDVVTETGKKDPFSISVYTLKELILREWREEWNDKPASPSSIRLIHFGKLLDDKEQLKKYQFSRESPNVVHMSVRPAEMMEEAEDAKGKSSGREGRTREGSGNCCVIL